MGLSGASMSAEAQLEAVKAVAGRAIAEGRGADDRASAIEVLKRKG